MLKEGKRSFFGCIVLLVLGSSLGALFLGLVFEWAGVAMLGAIGSVLAGIPVVLMLAIELWETNTTRSTPTAETPSESSITKLADTDEREPGLPKHLPGWLDDLSDEESWDYIDDIDMDEDEDENPDFF